MADDSNMNLLAPEMISTDIGRRIEQLRLSCGITQAQQPVTSAWTLDKACVPLKCRLSSRLNLSIVLLATPTETCTGEQEAIHHQGGGPYPRFDVSFSCM